MSSIKSRNLFLAGTVLLGTTLAFVSGCSSPSRKLSGGDAAPVSTASESKASGSQLWAQNCSRCHNVRSPSTFSDAEWEVAVHHMRIRGYLTGEEAREIVKFLKASN